MSWELDKETIAIIEWLRSPAGRIWSRQHNKPTNHMRRWFTLKDDYENLWPGDPDSHTRYLEVNDSKEILLYLGQTSANGAIYRPPRRGYLTVPALPPGQTVD